jgi:hypothetical protein
MLEMLKSGLVLEKKNNIGRTPQAKDTRAHIWKNINVLYINYSETALAAKHLMMAQWGRNMT